MDLSERPKGLLLRPPAAWHGFVEFPSMSKKTTQDAGTGTDLDLGAWVDLAMRCGTANLKAMELLDAANTGTKRCNSP